MRRPVIEHARWLYWWGIIKVVRGLTWLGAVGLAEWIARETGLRARVIEILYGPGGPREDEDSQR